MNAFPLPNGPDQDDGAAAFNSVFSNPSESNTGSFRLDHRFNDRWTAFARYSNSVSDGNSRGSEMTSPNMISTRNSKSQTYTGSLIRMFSARTTNDLRVNYSRSQTDIEFGHG